MNDEPIYCHLCDHSIPLSPWDRQQIRAGEKHKPTYCEGCRIIQAQLVEEIEDEY